MEKSNSPHTFATDPRSTNQRNLQLCKPASGKVLFQEMRYCGLTGHGMMKEKANTIVRQRNKERKKTAVRQWVSLAKPKTSLQLFFFSAVEGAISPPSSALFRGSTSAALTVVSILESMHYL